MKQKLEELLKEATPGTIRHKALTDALENETPIDYLRDVAQHGCVSGVCTDLIYYNDTHEFFDTFYNDIQENLEHHEQMTGMKVNIDSTSDIKNQLAWFGYESEVHKIHDELQND